MLAVAERVSAYFEGMTQSGELPPWDFADPSSRSPRDASASAAMALGHLVLAAVHPDPMTRSRFDRSGRDLLATLTRLALNRDPDVDGILLHSCYSVPHNRGVDGATAWGDFFYGLAMAIAHGALPISLILGRRGDVPGTGIGAPATSERSTYRAATALPLRRASRTVTRTPPAVNWLRYSVNGRWELTSAGRSVPKISVTDSRLRTTDGAVPEATERFCRRAFRGSCSASGVPSSLVPAHTYRIHPGIAIAAQRRLTPGLTGVRPGRARTRGVDERPASVARWCAGGLVGGEVSATVGGP